MSEQIFPVVSSPYHVANFTHVLNNRLILKKFPCAFFICRSIFYSHFKAEIKAEISHWVRHQDRIIIHGMYNGLIAFMGII